MNKNAQKILKDFKDIVIYNRMNNYCNQKTLHYFILDLVSFIPDETIKKYNENILRKNRIINKENAFVTENFLSKLPPKILIDYYLNFLTEKELKKLINKYRVITKDA